MRSAAGLVSSATRRAPLPRRLRSRRASEPKRRVPRLRRSPIGGDERGDRIFIAFLAYCLQVTLKQRLRSRAPGLTPRSVLDKMAAIQMVDVHLPTTVGRTVILSRYTEPESDQALLLQILKLSLPGQPPPKIMSDGTPMSQ